MTGAHDVIQMLRTHYLPEGKPPPVLFMPEIGAPDGSRRADLLVAPVSMSVRHHTLVGHEVKVSRSDVVAELVDATKPDAWMQYCSRWWLTVSDPKLIAGLEIPESWGIMAPPSGRRTRSMTILRDAPKLTPAKDLSPALTRISAYVVARMETQLRNMQWEVEGSKREIDRLRAELEQRNMAGEYGRIAPQAIRLTAILKEVEKRSAAKFEGLKNSWWWMGGPVEDEVVIEALTDHKALRAISQRSDKDLEELINKVEHAAKPFAEIRTALLHIRKEHSGT